MKILFLNEIVLICCVITRMFCCILWACIPFTNTITEIKLQNLKPLISEVVWTHTLICFSKLFKKYGGRCSKYCKFFFSPQQYSVELFKTLTWS